MKIPKGADPRDAAEMRECQCIMRTKLEQPCVCGLGADGKWMRPPVPDDFEFFESMFLDALDCFGMPEEAIDNLRNHGVETVADARIWLESGGHVGQVGPIRIAKMRAAIEAAERWGRD